MPRRKLLLADDSITIQKVVNLTFADEGIDVIAVGDGDAALAALSSDTPDILLADVNMPGPTGYEICERLRANEATRNLPVILLVGSFEPFDEAEASRVGANAYLTKPFQSIRQLVAQVNELIAAAEPPADVSAAPEGAPESNVAVNGGGYAAVGEPASHQSSGEMPSVPAVEEAAPRYFDDLGYPTSVPPIEPAPVTTQADDIDRLYEQSLSGTPDDLADVGIDDEIIETSYAADASSDGFDPIRTEVASEPVAAQSESNVEEASSEAIPSAFATAGDQQPSAESSDSFENTIAYEGWRPADMRDDSPIVSEVPQSLETTKLDEAYTQAAEPTSEPAVGEDTIRMEDRFNTTGSASFQFDDVNLLDLSGDAEAPIEITSPANALEQGSSKQVVTLSPELIEMIAQRVVEKLSEKY